MYKFYNIDKCKAAVNMTPKITTSILVYKITGNTTVLILNCSDEVIKLLQMSLLYYKHIILYYPNIFPQRHTKSLVH